MNDEEFERIWKSLDTRINTINERTKTHTLEIREIRKQLKGGLKEEK